MKYKYFFYLIPFFVINCVKEQQKVSWLKIEKWELLENINANNDQGELTHNFNQVFLNMDGKVIGAFELPAKVPILAQGEHNFVLLPGIVNNGINATKRRYPFVEAYTTDFTLILEDTVTMSPKTMYFDGINFLIEDFESPALSIENDESGNCPLYRDNDPEILKWGNYFGRADLNDQDSLLIAFTTFQQSLPKQNSEVYLEFDYMISNPLITSVISYNSVSFHEDVHVQVNPPKEPEWRKIYIDLKEIISFRSQATVNEQVFTAILDKPGSEKFIYLDNIKVVFR